jgi:hypothetical protein
MSSYGYDDPAQMARIQKMYKQMIAGTFTTFFTLPPTSETEEERLVRLANQEEERFALFLYHMYLDREERKRVEQREREMKELVEHVLNYH